MDLQGKLIPAVPITFREDNSIDYDAMHRYAAYLVEEPIDGVAIWVHTGRGLFLSQEERLGVGRVWKEHLKHKQLLICGVGGEEDQRKVMGSDALALGADAILAYAPVAYRGKVDQDELIVKYHKALAEHPGLPMILFFLYEEAGGITYSLDVLNELLAVPQVVGIKMATLDSVMTYQDVSNFIAHHFPEKALITGEDRMFGYTLTRGANSALVGLGSICPAWQKELIQAKLEGRASDFLKAMRLVDALAEVTFVRPMEGIFNDFSFS